MTKCFRIMLSLSLKLPLYLLGLSSGFYSSNQLFYGHPVYFLGLFSGCYSFNQIILGTPCIFVWVVQLMLQFQSNYFRDTLYICYGCLVLATLSIKLFLGNPVYLFGLFNGCYSSNPIILGTPCIFVRVVQWMLQFQSNYSRDTLYICQGCLLLATLSIKLFLGHPVYMLGLFNGCYSFNPIILGTPCIFVSVVQWMLQFQSNYWGMHFHSDASSYYLDWGIL